MDTDEGMEVLCVGRRLPSVATFRWMAADDFADGSLHNGLYRGMAPRKSRHSHSCRSSVPRDRQSRDWNGPAFANARTERTHNPCEPVLRLLHLELHRASTGSTHVLPVSVGRR